MLQKGGPWSCGSLPEHAYAAFEAEILCGASRKCDSGWGLRRSREQFWNHHRSNYVLFAGRTWNPAISFRVNKVKGILEPWWIDPLADSCPLGKLVYGLPIFPLFPVKNGVFILWQHLLLPRHLLVPTLNCLGRHSTVLLECRIHGIHDFVDKLESFALSCFLRCGESPGDFPADTHQHATSGQDEAADIP